MSTDIEAAERAGQRRARIVTASAIVFLTTLPASTSEQRLVDHVRVVAWVVWGAMLRIISPVAGGWSQRIGCAA